LEGYFGQTIEEDVLAAPASAAAATAAAAAVAAATVYSTYNDDVEVSSARTTNAQPSPQLPHSSNYDYGLGAGICRVPPARPRSPASPASPHLHYSSRSVVAGRVETHTSFALRATTDLDE